MTLCVDAMPDDSMVGPYVLVEDPRPWMKMTIFGADELGSVVSIWRHRPDGKDSILEVRAMFCADLIPKRVLRETSRCDVFMNSYDTYSTF